MEEVPENAQEVPAVTSLDLSNNRIKHTLALMTYPYLIELNLSKNCLSGSLSAETFSALKCIKYMNLSFNRLVSVAGLENVRATLEHLEVNNNRLRLLNGIDACYLLIHLDVSNNLLSRSARQCGLASCHSLTKLKFLDFRKNPVCEEPGIISEMRTLVPFVRYMNGKDFGFPPSPQIATVQRSLVFNREKQPPASPRINTDVEKLKDMLADSIARKERLLRRLPVVF